MRKQNKHRCRCCGVVRKVGRFDICLPCYKTHGARVHGIASKKDGVHGTPPAAECGDLPECYSMRAESLKLLGFTSYKQYLSSPLWSKVKVEVLKKSQHCFRCHRIAKTLHHASYDVETMAGRDHSRLFSICMGCHKRAEINSNNEKKTLLSANKTLGLIGDDDQWTGRQNTCSR